MVVWLPLTTLFRYHRRGRQHASVSASGCRRGRTPWCWSAPRHLRPGTSRCLPRSSAAAEDVPLPVRKPSYAISEPVTSRGPGRAEWYRFGRWVRWCRSALARQRDFEGLRGAALAQPGAGATELRRAADRRDELGTALRGRCARRGDLHLHRPGDASGARRAGTAARDRGRAGFAARQNERRGDRGSKKLIGPSMLRPLMMSPPTVTDTGTMVLPAPPSRSVIAQSPAASGVTPIEVVMFAVADTETIPAQVSVSVNVPP